MHKKLCDNNFFEVTQYMASQHFSLKIYLKVRLKKHLSSSVAPSRAVFVCTFSSQTILCQFSQIFLWWSLESSRSFSRFFIRVFRCAPLSFFILLFDLSAVCAGVCSSSRDTCPYQDSRFFLMVSDQFVCFVLIISSSFVIICGHFMFMIFLRRFLWKVSIFYSLFLVNVHSSLLYRNIDATYALKALIRVLRLTLFDFRIFSFFLKAFIACLSLSSFDVMFRFKKTSK